MNWLNLETKMLHTPEFIGCEPAEQATWLKLMLYCANQENGGVVANSLEWKCRRWQQTCGVMRDEAHAECDLWSWTNSDLVLWGYPAEKEDELQRNRESGHRGGKARSDAKIEAAKANGVKGGRPKTQAITQAVTQGVCEENPSDNPTERKGKERKGMELSLSERASESESFSDNLPTAAVGGMEAIAAKICSLRPEWSRIALSYSERQSIIHNAASLHSVSSSDWRAIGDYLRATIPEGRPAWQPRNRSKFVETIGDVLGYALEWQRRRSPGPTLAQVLVPVKVVTPEERAETMNEFKQVFGKVTA